jgi:hypothetical protein
MQRHRRSSQWPSNLQNLLATYLEHLSPQLTRMLLDVATVLRGQPQDQAMAVWTAWHGPQAHSLLSDLGQRGLLTVDAEGRLDMGNVLAQCGRDITLCAHPLCPKLKEQHFGKRLWVASDVVVGLEKVHIVDYQ